MDLMTKPVTNAAVSAGPTAKAQQPNQIFLGRQPILGRDQELVAYELLFRASFTNAAEIIDNFAATATVIDSAFLALGMQQAIGDKTAFINVDADVLMSELIEVLPRERVVLEILEHVELTPALIAHCQSLKSEGYRLALDDVEELTPEQEKILHAVDYVKFDLHKCPLSGLAEQIARVHAAGVFAIVEKVETEEEFITCHAAGADFFQGYFFARPSVLTGRTMQPPKPILITILQLLAADVDIGVLETAIKGTPDLTVRLLRLANAAGMRSAYKITSLRNTILRLGTNQIRRIVQVSLFARAPGANIGSDPLIQAAAIRGHLMESLALARGLSRIHEEAFMVGMLSLAGPVLGQSIVDLLQVLNLGEAIRDALLLRAGPLGELLSFVEACEQFDGPGSRAILQGLSPAEVSAINRMQVEAIGWASSL